jgi:multidrug efflux pump subunit AcrB
MRVPKQSKEHPRFGDRLMAFGIRTYEPTLRWALTHRAVTLGGMGVVLIGVFMLFGRFNAGMELFPDVDPTYAYVSVEAPSGTRVELSDAYTQKIEKEVATLGDMKAYVTEVGATGGSEMGNEGAPPHLSLLSLEFLKHEERVGSSRQELEDLRERLTAFTGAEVFIKNQENGPPSGEVVNIEISGRDFEELGRLAEQVRNRIRDIPGLVNLQDTYDPGRPEISVRPDPDKAARYGLRTNDIASTVRTALTGNDVSKFRIGEDEYDITVRYAGPARGSVEDLEKLTVFYEGENVPLTAFADVSYTTGLGAISRIDGRRVVTVTAGAAAGVNGNALLAEAQSRLTDFELPRGYSISYTGESEEQEEAQQFLSDAFAIALMLIFVILITQFTSVTVPFVILSSVVLSLIGVLVGLLVNRMPFGIIMTGVGVISLAGIVVNNAIVLLDYVIKLQAEGLEKFDAIVQAGRTRFRPVVLTAITTVLGLIPLTTGMSINFNHLFAGEFDRALSIGGESSQWWGQMGVAVIWGLVIATFLTLVIVPVMYSSIDPIKRAAFWLLVDSWRRPLRRLRKGPVTESS